MSGRPDRRWDVAILVALTALNLWLASPVLGEGLLADNDFVGHYAYTQLLADQVWPNSGSVSSWSPRFNLGAPFLLFNPPPLLYVLSAVTSWLLGITALTALKGWLTAAYLAVPLTTYAWCRELEPRPSRAPLAAAILTSALSSELFGLDFFFRNGMANAAVALPLLLLVWTSFTRAVRSAGTDALWATAWGAIAFAALTTTHLSSAYMACLGMTCMALVDQPRRWGGNIVRVAGIIGVGLLLACAWLVPSLPFAPEELVARTWLRNPVDVAKGWLLGDIFSSYHAAFFHRFRAYSTVGAVGLLLGVFGLTVAVTRRDLRVVGVGLWSLVALWVTMGPKVAGPLVAIPLYDQLLWYRFLTPAILCWLVVGGFGIARLIEDSRLHWNETLIASGIAGVWLIVAPHFLPISWLVAVGALGWAGLLLTRRDDLLRWGATALLVGLFSAVLLPVLYERSSAIRVSSDYWENVEDAGDIIDWLVANAEPDARIYGEFANNNVADNPSVNYLRHALPTATGLDEVAGWIYETNLASARLQERGLFWYTPLPMLEEYARYSVKYITASSPNLKGALSQDPRWEMVVMTPSYHLYRAVNYTPQRVEDPSGRLQAHDVQRGYDDAGQWRIRFDVAGSAEAGEVVVKTNWVSVWEATVDGAPAMTHATEDGLLAVSVSAGSRPVEVELIVDLNRHRKLGWWLTGIGAALLAGLLSLGIRHELTIPALADTRILRGIGLVIGVSVALTSLYQARDRHPSEYVFGLTNGMETVRDPADLYVGAYDDLENGGLNFLLAPAWEDRRVEGLTPARSPVDSASVHAIITASRTSPTLITIDGHWRDDGPTHSPIQVEFVDLAARQVLASTELAFGQEVSLPPELLADVPTSKTRPGVPLGLRLHVDRPVSITRIRTETDLVSLQGESFHNHTGDQGDMTYFAGRPDALPHDGALLAGAVTRTSSPIRAVRDISLPPGEYELWARIYGAPVEWRSVRAEAWFLADRKLIGAVDGVGRSKGDRLELVWEKVGTLQGGPETTLELYIGTDTAEQTAWADVDLLALVPVSDGPVEATEAP